MSKNLYRFGAGHSERPHIDVADVGNKAFNLMRMDQLGLPVPPGFVLGTQACQDFQQAGGRLNHNLRKQIVDGVQDLERMTQRQFAGKRRPLLVSVRSGAALSMPGMMETLLNIGLCERTLPGFLRMTGNPHLVWDSYRRMIQMFGEVVYGVPARLYESLNEAKLQQQGVRLLSELDTAALRELATASLDLTESHCQREFPQEPMDQLCLAVEAVFRSWQGDKAKTYRALHAIDDAMGTAVTVQAMVFGNAGSNSGAGVGFTRDPSNGENRLYVDFMFNAQGEDVVSGRYCTEDVDRLASLLPTVYADLLKARAILEREFGDMQDFEFTVENGKLFLLQTRNGKRSTWSGLRVLRDFAREGLISGAEIRQRLQAMPIQSLRRQQLMTADKQPVAAATVANMGVAVGRIVLDLADAGRLAKTGDPLILVRPNMDTADIAAFELVQGILTAKGARTSHGAVVARQLDKVCLVGCKDLRIDEPGHRCWLGQREFSAGDYLTLDAHKGLIYGGKLELIEHSADELVAEIVALIDDEATAVMEPESRIELAE